MKKTLSLLILSSAIVSLAACSNTKEYTVRFMSDGNPYGQPQIVKEGQYASKPAKDPYKEEDETYHYTFKCWYDSNDESKTPFNFETTAIKQNYTLVADFEVIEKIYFTISFDLDGGEGSFESVKVEQNKFLSKPSSEPTKEDDHDFYYTFDYWFDKDDETESEYNFNSPVTHDFTLKAHYAKTAKVYYSVSFDLNGGTGDVSIQEIEEGHLANKPDCIPTKGADHDNYYSFAYWYNQDDLEELEFDFDNTPILGETTLKAKYNAIPRIWHIVSFDLNGGTGTFSPIEVEDNKTISEPSNKPLKEEDHDYKYTFDYWFDSNDETETKFNFDSPITSNLVLKAHYKAIERIYYTVSFDVNGGKGTFAPLEVEQGMYATKPEGEPTKDADHDNYYSFAYWYEKNESEFNFETTRITRDMTLKAKYNETPRVYYTVSFDLDGGKGSIAPQEIEKGNLATKPEYIPIKDADHDYKYTFAYWYNQDDLTKSEFDFTTPINESIVLKAKYNETARIYYSVSFNLNGGSGTFPTQEIEKGFKAQKPIDNPTKQSDTKDYKFAYWCLDLEQPEEFDFGTNITESITLYAYYYETDHVFNIVWRQPNGEIITTTKAFSGEVPSYPFGIPYLENSESKDEGYLFNHWYNTTDETEGISEITNHDVIYEATYDSCPINDSMIVVEIPTNSKEFHISNYYYPSETGTIDWGDGTINNQISHTYVKEGRYVIKVSGFAHVGIYNPAEESVSSKVRMVRLGENIQCIDYKDWSNGTNIENLVLPYSCRNNIVNNAFSNSNIDTLVYYDGSTFGDFLTKNDGLSVKNLIINTESDDDLPSTSFRSIKIETMTILGNLKTILPCTFMSNGNIKAINIKAPITKICERAFFGCGKLEKINIPSTVTSMNEYGTFSGCTSLSDIYLPSSIEEFGSYAFSSTAFKSFDLPYIKKVGGCAFATNNNLKSVKFSSTLETLSSSAFMDCYGLATIDMTDFDGTKVPSIDLTKDFKYIPDDCIILVKDQKAYDSFKSDSHWKFAAHRLVIQNI